MEHSPIEPRVLLFRRVWHVISELDIAPLLADHAELRRVCGELEALADRLGAYPSLAERRAAADLIQVTILQHVKVTNAFLQRVFGGEQLRFGGGLLSRILLWQISDAIHAEDLAEALRAEDLNTAKIDTLSYMLRCLFDSCRRALDFEELALLQLAEHRLTQDARLALEHRLEQPADSA